MGANYCSMLRATVLVWEPSALRLNKFEDIVLLAFVLFRSALALRVAWIQGGFCSCSAITNADAAKSSSFMPHSNCWDFSWLFLVRTRLV